MRLTSLALCLAALVATGCSHSREKKIAIAQLVDDPAPAVPSARPAAADSPIGYENGVYRGFDRNDYPGDDVMHSMMTDHPTFAFTGYWLTNPPGETSNTWAGKRSTLLQQGWGFLVLANGRLDAEILKAQKQFTSPAALAQADAAAAIAAARADGFPAHTILFLDQEEGGVLLSEQAAYLLAWTEAVAASTFLPGVYASGQPVPNGPGLTTTTIQDIRARVQAGHLHPIAFFDAQDTCPPAPGCTLHPRPLAAAGLPVLAPGGDLIAWQFAQSPRRPELTRSCAQTYANASGNQDNCYAPNLPTMTLDMDAASSSDPSHGR